MSKNQTEAAGPFYTGHCLLVIKKSEKNTQKWKKDYLEEMVQ